MNKLSDWLEETRTADRVRVATGFLDERGLEAILNNTPEEAEVKILVGEVLERRGSDALSINRQEVSNIQKEELVYELYQRLQKNISVRALDGLHAKLYLSDVAGLSGSSNLTQGGIESNIEYNTKLKPDQYDRASDWFDKRWEKGKTLTDEFIRKIEESSYGAKVVEVPVGDSDRLSRVANIQNIEGGLFSDTKRKGTSDTEMGFTELSLASQIALLDEKITRKVTGNQMRITGNFDPDPDSETVEYLKQLLIEASKKRGGRDGFREFINEYEYAKPSKIKRIRYVWKELNEKEGCRNLGIRNNGIAWLLEWWLDSGGVSQEELPGEVRLNEKRPVLTLDLWDHQRRAIDEWNDNDCEGVVEMATGTGKTAVGLAAIEQVCNKQNSADILIVAHTNALVDQWEDKLEERFGRVSFEKWDYYINVETTGKVTSNLERFENRAGGGYDLIIIDEVHRYANYGGESWGEVTKLNSQRTLGLSALVSNENRKKIEPTVGDIVFEYSQKEAIQDGTIPEFRWLLHEVELTSEEREKYHEITKEITTLLGELESHPYVEKLARKNEISLMDFGPGIFIELQNASNGIEDEVPEEWTKLSNAFQRRREVVYRSQNAKQATAELAQKYVERGQDLMIFTMRTDYADDLSEMIDSTQVVHSNTEEEEAISEFKQGDKNVLISVKMFDEGVDIPDVDVGINVAAEKTQRQLVQRRGRILRRSGEYTPVFHQFVIEEEADYYSELGSVEPEMTEPEPVIEESLPIKMGTVDVWDIYHSLDSDKLRQIMRSDDFVEDGLTGKEWWLQIYLDTHEDMFHEKIQEDVDNGESDPGF